MGIFDSLFYTPPSIVPSYILIDLIDWAKESLGRLPQSVKKASFHVQWTKEWIKESLYYKVDDDYYVCEGLNKITIEELLDYKNQPLAEHGILTDEVYNVLTSDKSMELALLIRDNDIIKVKSDIIFDPFCVLLSKE